jgi:hypothetical protein
MKAAIKNNGQRTERSTPGIEPVFSPAAIEAIRASELALLDVVRIIRWQSHRLASVEARIAAGDTRPERTSRSGTLISAAEQARRKIERLRIRVAEAELAHQRAWGDAIAEAFTIPVRGHKP